MNLVKYPNPILDTPMQEVNVENPGFDPVKLKKEMIDLMVKSKGLGLSACQVGLNYKLFVIGESANTSMMVINPEIIETDGECTWEEGCLSVPDCTEEVKRKKKVTVRYQNLEGETLEIVGEDLMAIALQHEIDHLDGILFIDRLSRLKRNLLKKKLREESPENKKL